MSVHKYRFSVKASMPVNTFWPTYFGPDVHWGPVAEGRKEPSLPKWELRIYKDVELAKYILIQINSIVEVM